MKKEKRDFYVSIAVVAILLFWACGIYLYIVIHNQTQQIEQYLKEIGKAQATGVYYAMTSGEDVQEILDIDTFQGDGYADIISANGEFIYRSSHPNSNQTIQNVYDIKFKDNQARKELEYNLQNNKNGILVISFYDEPTKKIATYTPIGIGDLYVFSFVTQNTLNARFVETFLLTIAFFLAFIVAFFLLIILLEKTRQKSRKQINTLAYVDPLTKGFNRNKFIQEANKKTEEPYTLGMVDIDNFKAINDLFGAKQADQILKSMYCILQETLPADTIIARSFADVFLFYIPDLLKDNVILQEVLDKSKKIVKNKYEMTIRMGLFYSQDQKQSNTIEYAIDRAKYALTIAKTTSQSIVIYDNRIDEQIKRKNEIEKQMKQALAKEEFKIYIQPQIDSKTRKVVSGEALLRWENQELNNPRPDEFIPIFEKNGFIKQIDQYVLETVCRMQKRWQEENKGINIPIAVNQSILSLFEQDYMKTVIKTLEKYQVDPGLIEIELTETVIANNILVVKEIINQFHEIGIKVAMDDFGSGYSSFNMIKQIEVDVFKLDKEFLKDFEKESKQEYIVQSILNMAKKLKMITVVEGVETEIQANQLEALGCDRMQGYLFDRPIKIKEFEQKYEKRTF